MGRQGGGGELSAISMRLADLQLCVSAHLCCGRCRRAPRCWRDRGSARACRTRARGASAASRCAAGNTASTGMARRSSSVEVAPRCSCALQNTDRHNSLRALTISLSLSLPLSLLYAALRLTCRGLCVLDGEKVEGYMQAPDRN